MWEACSMQLTAEGQHSAVATSRRIRAHFSDHYRLILKDIMRKMDLFEGWCLRCINQQFLTLSCLIFFLPDAIKRAHISKPSIITINRSNVAVKSLCVYCLFVSKVSTLLLNGC